MMDTKIKSLEMKPVVTVSVKTPLREIIEVMEEHNINHLPVLGWGDMIAGIVSKHDVYRNLLKLSVSTTGKTYSEKMLNSVLAEEMMTLDVAELGPEDTIQEAADVLLKGEFHACPVVENYKVIGILTAKDIMKHISEDLIVKNRNIERTVTVDE
jgi:predicted transcriptional regulator